MELINVTYYDPIHGQLHVRAYLPYGTGGNGVHVLVNDYFRGQIVHYPTGWVSYVELGILNQDDVDAIMDAIEGADI